MHEGAQRPVAGGMCAGSGRHVPGAHSLRLTTDGVSMPATARNARDIANYVAILFGLCAAIAGGMFLTS
jgi:hypothetical protein